MREIDRCARVERWAAALDQLVVERDLEAVFLLAHAAPRHGRGQTRLVQQRLQVEPLGLPVGHGALDVEAVHAADHLVHRPEAELGHQLAHLLGDEAEEVFDELGRAVELLAQHRILCRDANRAGIQMADAHHDAAHHDQRRRGEAVFLGAEHRADDDVAPGLHLAVNLHDDAIAELVQDQHLLRFREAQLPREAGVLQTGQRRRTGTAVVAGDQDDVGVGLGDARRHRADSAFSHELHRDARLGIRVLQVEDQLRQILD